MQKIRKLSSSAALLLVALLFLTAIPTFAHESGTGHKHGSADTTRPERPDATVSSTAVDDSETQNRGSVKNAQATANKQAKAEAKALQNSEKRKKICVARTNGLETKFNRIITNSEKHKERIDDILSKAVLYQKEENVTAENFDQLATEAATQATAVEAAIEKLKAVEPKIDCNNNGQVAALVGSFKTEAQATRDALKTYKQSVKAVLKSLLDAKQTTDGEDNTSTENTGTEGGTTNGTTETTGGTN